ncbi:LOW QUALITY PROTEIN: hypothetical protein CVT26_005674 [Gymnopilus dilepis]|uniref:Uncharacterized protein n=1 Tax=Gymnopilus dilepis TaxID=231916 RepID=A0A409WC29_9AGAR|nr:LOW QUALITY PROTEIN: hypothetical protein CVT26_005674 [Gymnopilus dilepis]
MNCGNSSGARRDEPYTNSTSIPEDSSQFLIRRQFAGEALFELGQIANTQTRPIRTKGDRKPKTRNWTAITQRSRPGGSQSKTPMTVVPDEILTAKMSKLLINVLLGAYNPP